MPKLVCVHTVKKDLLKCRNIELHRKKGKGKDKFCVHCVKYCLEYETRIALPALVKLVQHIKLPISYAAPIMLKLTDIARSNNFPSDLLKTSIIALNMIIEKLDVNNQIYAIEALTDCCLKVVKSTNSITKEDKIFISILIKDCILKNSHLTLKTDKLQELLINPFINKKTRFLLLKFLEKYQTKLKLLQYLANKLENSISSPEYFDKILTLFEVIHRIIRALPENMDEKSLKHFKVSREKILGVIKCLLISRDTDVQVSSGNCLLSLLLRNDIDLANLILNQRFGEIILSALNTDKIEILEILFRCVSHLARKRSSGLFTSDVYIRMVQIISRNIQLLLEQNNNENLSNTIYAGLILLATIFSYSTLNTTLFDQTLNNQVKTLISEISLSEDEPVNYNKEMILNATSILLSEFLFALPKGCQSNWIDLPKILSVVINYIKVESVCTCFILHLSMSAVKATSGNTEISEAVQEWATNNIKNHSVACVLIEPVRNSRLYQLIKSLQILYEEENWKSKLTMAKFITSNNFLLYAYTIINEKDFRDRGSITIANILYSLYKIYFPHSNKTIDEIEEGLLELPEIWIDSNKPFKNAQSRDIALSLAYLHIMETQENTAKCSELLPGVLSLLSHVGNINKLSVDNGKMFILILGCANAEYTDTVQNLLNRWSPAANLIYSHNFKLLKWTLHNLESAVELRSTFITEWISKEENSKYLVKLFRDNSKLFPSIMDAVHRESKAYVSHNIAKVIMKLCLKKGPLHEQFWLRISSYLQRSTNGGKHSNAILLQLAGKLNIPRNNDIRTAIMENIFTLLPTMIDITSTDSWTCVRHSAIFKILSLIFNSIHSDSHIKCASKLLENGKFLQVLSLIINQRQNKEEYRARAIEFLVSVIKLMKRSNSTSLEFGTTITLDKRALLFALEGVTSEKTETEKKISLATVNLIGVLPEPCYIVTPGSLVAIILNENDTFISSLYRTLHYIKSANEDNDVASESQWKAMINILTWSNIDSLINFPWTHSMICITSTSNRPETIKAMLEFTHKWLELLINRGDYVTQLNFLSRTLEHILNNSDHYSTASGCLNLLIDIITTCLNMENELEPRVIKLAKLKLEELKYYL